MTLTHSKPDRPALLAQNTGSGCDLLYAVKLTVPQAARRIGIGETKMRSILRQGGMPVLRIGGKTVIIERDIEEYLQGQYGRLLPAAKPTIKSKMTPLPKEVSQSSWLEGTGTKL